MEYRDSLIIQVEYLSKLIQAKIELITTKNYPPSLFEAIKLHLLVVKGILKHDYSAIKNNINENCPNINEVLLLAVGDETKYNDKLDIVTRYSDYMNPSTLAELGKEMTKFSKDLDVFVLYNK